MMNDDKINAVLWDIKEEDRISLPTDFLIKRLLVYGGASLLREMFLNYGVDKTKEVFNSLKVSEVGEKRFNFLKNYIFI